MSKKKRKKKSLKARRRSRKGKTSRAFEASFLTETASSSGGFDYGILPTVACAFDPEFVSLWNKAKCIGIGYTEIPQYGMRHDLLQASLIFEDHGSAANLFRLIKSWMEPPCDESAINICFVEDAERKKYYLNMGVDPEQLLIRTLGIDAERDFIPLEIVAYASKEFHLSEAFKRFRQIAEGEEIMLCVMKADPRLRRTDGWASVMLPADDSMIDLELAFIKRDIRFLDRRALTPELAAFYEECDGKRLSKDPPSPRIPSPREVETQRQKQLRRFFPVTLARLSCNESFERAKQEFANEYQDWQITQAACNLFARANWSEFGYGKNIQMFEIYQRLRESRQDATEKATLTFVFEESKMREQIKTDQEYLHSCVCPGSKGDPREELESKGYLSNGPIDNT